MKKVIALFAFLFAVTYGHAQTYSPFLDFGNVQGDINSVRESVKSTLNNKGFKTIGEYHVQARKDQYVIVFTNDNIISATTQSEKSGLLSAALKVALTLKNNEVNITATNPEYTFIGFLRNNYDKQEVTLKSESQKFINAVKSIGQTPVSFGGSLTESKLKSFRYMVSMPYFNDFVEIAAFPSFAEGVKTIQTNLDKSKGDTQLVYRLSSNNVAVFGVGLLDKAIGESHFLPVIGDKHIAALPYEIFIIDNKAYILHGRFRFAFYWPDLKMSTFMKIVSTPGNVKNQLKGLTDR